MTMGERWARWISAQIGTSRGAAAALAHAVSVTDSTVSRWRSGAQPQPEQCRAIAEHFGVPVLTVFVEAEYLTDDEANTPATPDLPTMIRQDTTLLPEARQHFANQYELLRRLTTTPAVSAPAGTQRQDERLEQVAARRGKRIGSDDEGRDTDVSDSMEPVRPVETRKRARRARAGDTAT